MRIKIEKATASDAEALLSYLKQIGGETDNLSFGGEGLPFSVEAEAEYLSALSNSKDEVMLLAKENGRIIGNASLCRLPRRMNHRGEISVTVLKEYWNRGIGTFLLQNLLDFAKAHSFDGIDLQVRSDNGAAIHLYERLGFKKIGTHPAFFKINGVAVPFDYMYLNL